MRSWIVLVLALAANAAAQWPGFIDVVVPESGAVTFTSPGYPAKLQLYQWLRYRIRAPPGRAIKFTVEFYKFGDGNNKLEFYEYPVGYTSPNVLKIDERFDLGFFSKNENFQPFRSIIQSGTNDVFAEMKVRPYMGTLMEGFEITARSVPNCHSSATVVDVSVPAPNASSSHQREAHFASPCYPNTYPSNLNLMYNVHTEPGLKMQFFRSDLAIRSEDSLTATEVLADGRQVTRAVPAFFRSQTNKVVFTFTTGSGVDQGFEIKALSFGSFE